MRKYTKRVMNYAQYANMRGVADFTNAGQFNLYQSGYAHLFVIDMPNYINKLVKNGASGTEADSELKALRDTFKYILEYEFKGLSGIEDVTADPLEFTDGINTMNLIGKVNKQSATEISMQFTEKSGSCITNFLKYYLEGIKDPRTQAKTYHGLIKNGLLNAGFEHEIFNMMYIVTDDTMLTIEKAYLLCNAWPTKASTSIYETEKGSIDKKDIDITFQCYVVDGPDVDKRALQILSDYNELNAVYNATAYLDSKHANLTATSDVIAPTQRGSDSGEGIIHLESDGGQDENRTLFKYGMLDKDRTKAGTSNFSAKSGNTITTNMDDYNTDKSGR